MTRIATAVCAAAVVAIAAVASGALAGPIAPPHPPMIQKIKPGVPPRYDLQRALAMATAYATEHSIRLDKAGYLQAGVFDLETRNWVFDWMSPTERVTIITVHEDGSINASP